MHLLDTITITVSGLMVGNELAVSAFMNPAVWRLESGPQAQGLSLLARSLGRVMPIWYSFCLALLALETFLHRNEPAFVALLIATLIWVGVIVYTITSLVPLNNRVAASAPGWELDHKRWDARHRVRIGLLAAAFFALAYALAA